MWEGKDITTSRKRRIDFGALGVNLYLITYQTFPPDSEPLEKPVELWVVLDLMP